MPVPDHIKKNWIEIQQKHAYPVNAIGVRIDARDLKTLNVWKAEGLDRFLKK